MSSYVLMKVLESTPSRYDRGLRLMTCGRIIAAYQAVAELAGAGPGRHILDLGCGTGGVALACGGRGAEVVGIDRNPGMLAVAKARALPEETGGRTTWMELGVAELPDRFSEESFDAVVSCLLFSELSPDEIRYTLAAARRCLRPGGRLVVADEVLPATRLARWWHRLRRLPQAVLTYLLTQTSTRPVEALGEHILEAGFGGLEERPIPAGMTAYTACREAPQ